MIYLIYNFIYQKFSTWTVWETLEYNTYNLLNYNDNMLVNHQLFTQQKLNHAFVAHPQYMAEPEMPALFWASVYGGEGNLCTLGL